MKKLFVLSAWALFGCLSTAANAEEVQCKPSSEAEILAQFERWNLRLGSGDPEQVAALYSEDAILLPTLSNQPRLTTAQRIQYFTYFLGNRPSGRLDSHHLALGCNTAVLSGLYTFTFASNGESAAARYTYAYRWDGQQWLITSHHSSLLPSN
ncbi:DUF4440 domain-containing protein [Pseudomonas tructae]|uniref:DUF4440 domain-containing protein n=1 Tax=Pseudomonas tructae TaxID=2518644 RepID=A0A411MJQ2_9PSED|nr:DUF4440 domain-containing protein [Pseudomonas tructae]QBF27023.1 DUF4440 domain-containing protein [Pseudomonas tructae]